MPEKDKEQVQQPPAQEQQPQAQQAPAQDHSTLVDALKQAFPFGSRSVYPAPSTEVKVGMDETIPGGKYIRFGQLVNADGEPIDEQGNKLKKD